MAKGVSHYSPLLDSDDADRSLVVKPTATKIVVAAIDFGTTYSGYAYSLKTDFERDRKIITNQKWIGEGIVTEKAPTVVLFDEKGQFDSFGYEAENKYSTLADQNKHRGWQYFKRFKMELNKLVKLKRDMILIDDQNRKKPALDVFAEAIKYLKDHLMDALKDRLGGTIIDTDVFWILTVPAIWNDGAKQFMAEAAKMAGIPKEQFALALEPECAAICCMETTVFNQSTKHADLKRFEPGSQYMIVDLGGGTVDITMHEIDDNQNLKELYTPTGGPWGGTLVDKAFDEFLEEIFTEKVIQTFTKQHKEDELVLHHNFEVKKRSVKRNGSKITMRIPLSLAENGVKSKAETFGKSVTLNRDKMECDAEIFVRMFDESIKKTLAHLKVLSKQKLGDVDTILLVGGFAESDIIKQAICQEFSKERVITPDDAGLAVVKGAVMFGFTTSKLKLFYRSTGKHMTDPKYHLYTCISSRKMPYTYGIAAAVPFDATYHPADKKAVRYGVDKCEDIFKVFVSRGADVIPGETVVEYTFNSPYKEASCTTIEIYKSTETHPRFTTDMGCVRVGELNLQMNSKGKHKVEQIDVKMLFGDTQLEVEAKLHGKSDVVVTAEFDFLS